MPRLLRSYEISRFHIFVYSYSLRLFFLLTLFRTASFLYLKGDQAWGLTFAFIVKHTHKTGFFQSPQMFTKVHKFWAPKSSKCPQFTILYFSSLLHYLNEGPGVVKLHSNMQTLFLNVKILPRYSTFISQNSSQITFTRHQLSLLRNNELPWLLALILSTILYFSLWVCLGWCPDSDCLLHSIYHWASGTG